jgi:hypothetical protein
MVRTQIRSLDLAIGGAHDLAAKAPSPYQPPSTTPVFIDVYAANINDKRITFSVKRYRRERAHVVRHPPRRATLTRVAVLSNVKA